VVCDDNSRLLHGYLDGELDLIRSLEIEEHLKTCPDCAQQLWGQQTLRKAFRSSNLYERAPSALAVRIRASIPQATAREAVAPLQSKPIFMLLPRRKVWNWLAVAAAIFLAALLTWRALPGGRGDSDLVAREIVATHIRSLQPGHLFDVQSTDQHTVKPWFNGKLDFSPPVRDLTEEGFPLIGGRLDYIDHRAVAALVYQRRQHLINVFIWPAEKQTDNNLHSESSQGYNMVVWERDGMYLCAVSDLSTGELQQFAQLIDK
jgi:anti-sigma factor RsiW